MTAALTWQWRVRDIGRAEMTVYFHRNSEMAKVVVGGEVRLAGYNVVLWNQGPAAAAEVSFRAFLTVAAIRCTWWTLTKMSYRSRGWRLELAIPSPGCWRPRSLDAIFNARCPGADRNGRHSIMLPLRRGETSQ